MTLSVALAICSHHVGVNAGPNVNLPSRGFLVVSCAPRELVETGLNHHDACDWCLRQGPFQCPLCMHVYSSTSKVSVYYSHGCCSHLLPTGPTDFGSMANSKVTVWFLMIRMDIERRLCGSFLSISCRPRTSL